MRLASSRWPKVRLVGWCARKRHPSYLWATRHTIVGCLTAGLQCRYVHRYNQTGTFQLAWNMKAGERRLTFGQHCAEGRSPFHEAQKHIRITTHTLTVLPDLDGYSQPLRDMAPERNTSSLGRSRRGLKRAAAKVEATESHNTDHPGPSGSQAIPPAVEGPVARAATRVPGSSEAGGGTGSPTTTRQTRKRKREPPEADIPTNIDEGGEGGEGEDDGDVGYACPFFKHNPIAHFLCILFCFTRYPDLTQHILRKHTINLLYCPCCYIEFGSEAIRDQHIQLRCCNQANPPQHKVLMREYRKLIRRSKDTMLSKWYNAWDILFPGQPKPESALIHRDARDAFIVIEYLARKVLPTTNTPANLGIFHDILGQLRGGATGVTAIAPAIVPVPVPVSSGPTGSWISVTGDETQYLVNTQDRDVFTGSAGVDFGMAEGFPITVPPRLTGEPEPWLFEDEEDSMRALMLEAGAYYIGVQDGDLEGLDEGDDGVL
jgi:hypothetical protein